jgi:hypothetical protein
MIGCRGKVQREGAVIHVIAEHLTDRGGLAASLELGSRIRPYCLERRGQRVQTKLVAPGGEVSEIRFVGCAGRRGDRLGRELVSVERCLFEVGRPRRQGLDWLREHQLSQPIFKQLPKVGESLDKPERARLNVLG